MTDIYVPSYLISERKAPDQFKIDFTSQNKLSGSFYLGRDSRFSLIASSSVHPSYHYSKAYTPHLPWQFAEYKYTNQSIDNYVN